MSPGDNVALQCERDVARAAGGCARERAACPRARGGEHLGRIECGRDFSRATVRRAGGGLPPCAVSRPSGPSAFAAPEH
jgi:hypothetical protein